MKFDLILIKSNVLMLYLSWYRVQYNIESGLPLSNTIFIGFEINETENSMFFHP